MVDGSRRIIKAVDSLGDLSKTGRTVWDNMADSLRGLVKKSAKKADMLDNARYVDNAVDAASDAGKRLGDAAGGGGNAASKIGNSDIIAHSYTRDEIINYLETLHKNQQK